MAGKAPSNKVLLKPLVINNPFIKTPDEICDLFGFPISAREKVKLAEGFLGEKLPLSDRSLDNLSTKGVSEKTGNEILDPFFKKFESHLGLSIESLIPSNTREYDIHIMLQAALYALLHGVPADSPYRDCFHPLESFIKRRCAEFLLQVELADFHKKRGTTEEVMQNIADYLRPFIGKTMLSLKQQDEVLDAFNKYGRGGQVEFDNETLYSIVKLSQDFNLSLFASLDLTAFNMLLVHHSQSAQVKSILAQVFEQKDKSYFGKLLTFIKVKLDCSYSYLASYIPTEVSSTESGRTVEEAQIERLKEWRKGKSRPSFTTLDQFLNSLFEDDSLPILIYSYICLSLDRIISKHPKASEQELIRCLYSFEVYHEYYLREKEAED